MRLAEWESRLLADVLADAHCGRPLYLYVDRGLLCELSGLEDAQAAVDDFVAAFSAETTTERPFGAHVRALQRWRTEGAHEAPPIVAALAMTVLAVTEAPVGAAHGVYRRMNLLLHRDPVAVPPPGYMDDVPMLWRAWNEWLTSAGVAEPTARTHPHWTYQGWARSQGFLRRADRDLIHDWFDDAGLRRGDDIVKARLRSEFLSWLRFRGAVGARLLATIRDEASEAVLADVLAQELRLWNGPVQQTRSGFSLRGLVTYDEWTNVWSLTLRTPDELVGRTIGIYDEPYVIRHDDVLSIPVKTPPERLLGEGVVVGLGGEIRVRGGGQPAYLMAEAIDADGWVQVRTPALQSPYRVLVPVDRVGAARAAIAAAGADDLTETPVIGVDGWVWLSGVTMTSVADDITLFGLGSLVPRTPLRLETIGGLRVAADTYLDIGLPDIAAPPAANEEVLVDGAAMSLPDDGVITSLDKLALEPGRHLVRHGAASLTLRIVAFTRETPVSTPYGHAIASCGGVQTFSATERVDVGASLRGALLDGVAEVPPVRYRASRTAEMLVLTDEGGLFQVREDVPPWVEEAALPISCVDVTRIVRGVEGTPAYFLVRTSRRVSAIEISRDLTPSAGRLCVAARPDLVCEIATREWAIDGELDARRRDRALSAALRWSPARAQRLPDVTYTSRSGSVVVNDRRDGVHDDMLRWLSEREHGSVASAEFRTTWGWLAARRGRHDIADRWRFALYQLETLGHVEVDSRRSRIVVAPAVAVLLSDAAGFALLCGARPERLLERLSVDEAPELADARQHWDLHMRVQVDAHERAVGPTAIYLEWDPRRDDSVRVALASLGITVTSRTGDRLLEALPTIGQELQNAPILTSSPSHDIARRESSPDGRWTRVPSDAPGGLYRYLTAQGTRFAWREHADEPLRLIDRRLGLYHLARSIARDRTGQPRALTRDFRTKTLRVPRWLPLPPLVARALVLRTGLTPEPLHVVRPLNAERRYLVYRNVDQTTEDRVSRILDQKIGVTE